MVRPFTSRGHCLPIYSLARPCKHLLLKKHLDYLAVVPTLNEHLSLFLTINNILLAGL